MIRKEEEIVEIDVLRHSEKKRMQKIHFEIDIHRCGIHHKQILSGSQ